MRAWLLSLLLPLSACTPQGSDGGPTGRPLLSPVKLRGFGSRVAVGAGLVVVIRADGTLWAWGDNRDGELGTGPDIALYVGAIAPVQVSTATDWVAVSAGRFHSLARRADGSLWSWGDNNSAQLGNAPWPGPDTAWYNVPRRVGPAAARWAGCAGGAP
ncbi:MAG: hypothetical protein ACRYFX_03480 [Janthinobacterium lividum]